MGGNFKVQSYIDMGLYVRIIIGLLSVELSKKYNYIFFLSYTTIFLKNYFPKLVYEVTIIN